MNISYSRLPRTPENFDNNYDILKFVTRKIVYAKDHDQSYTFLQWASKMFGKGDEENVSLITKVTHNFPSYIQYQNKRGTKFKLDVELILKEHPQIFNLPEREINLVDPNDNLLLQEMRMALKDEIDAAIFDRTRSTYDVLGCNKQIAPGHKLIFKLILDISEDESIKVYEGMPAYIKIRQKNHSVEILDFDDSKSIVVIQSKFDFSDVINRKQWKLVLDSVWIIKALDDRIKNYTINKKYPIYKLLSNNPKPSPIPILSNKIYFDNLDESQSLSVKHAMTSDLSMIWGPPGTGKSYTLSYYLLNAFLHNKKVLVCAIANVAVDALVTAALKVFERYNNKFRLEYRNGSILRIGYTANNDLLSQDYLFPNSELITSYRSKLDALTTQINRIKKSDDKRNELLSKRVLIKQELDKLIKDRINSAKIVFCSASKVHVDELINSTEFDSLVVDEASMMGIPHFISLAHNITSSIVIAGDFRQLGPVALSHSHFSQKWLHRDIFQFFGLNTKARTLKHPALLQLLTQRRFHLEICDLINSHFYNGTLKSIEKPNHNRVIQHRPAIDRIVCYVKLKDDDNFKSEFSSKGSRYNKRSAEFIMSDIIKKLAFHPHLQTLKIGIVTPYKAQSNYLTKLLDQSIDNNYIKKNTLIGTIHSFQGSEADILILDLVESSHNKVGRLYMGDTGERLINVAISRAKSKLIVVGDIDALLNNSGSKNIESSTQKIFKTLKKKTIFKQYL